MSKGEGSRLLSVVLTGTGIAGLIASVYISARVGWSLADNEADKFVTAGILGLADFAAAMIIIAASRMRVWGWYARSYLAIVVAAVFLVAGYVTAYGFFSTRIAVHASQKAAAAVDKDYLKWLQGQTVNMELPRAQRFAMMKEAREGRDTLKSTMRVVSDKYAAAIGAWLGWTIEETQTRLTAATAAIAYSVKFTGLWFGVMLWPRRRDESDQSVSSSKKGGSGEGGGSDQVPNEKPRGVDDANVIPIQRKAEPAAQFQDASDHLQSENVGDRLPNATVSTGSPRVPDEAPGPPRTHKTNGYSRKFSQDEAEADLHRITSATGAQPTQQELAKLWGVSQQTVSRWQSEWAKRRERSLARVLRNSVRTNGAYGGSHASALG